MLANEGKLLIVYKDDIKNKTFNEWEGITSINPRCFYHASSVIEHIQIPDNITLLEEEAFLNCKKLKKVFIDDSCLKIGNGVFKHCSNLKYVKLPASLSYISENMFFDCRNLSNIVLPETVKIIKKNAFEASGLKKINFPAGLKKIKENAFHNNHYLRRIILPESLEELGESAFSSCSNLESIVLNNNLSYISQCCFLNCSSLKEIEIINNIKCIQSSAFFDCANLEKLIINNRNIDIEYFAFNNCNKLTNVIVLDKSYNIDDYKNFLVYQKTFEITAAIKLILGVDIETIKKSNIKYPASFIDVIKTKNIKKLYNKNAIKHFKNIYKNYENLLTQEYGRNLEGFYKFAYYIGCFSDKTYKRNNKEVSVSQKANVFLKKILDEKIIEFNQFNELFENLNVEENIDILKFISVKDNLDYLLDKKSRLCGILNKMPEIQKMIITDSKGRIIKNASLKRKIELYLSHERFKNVDEDSVELADELAKFPTITQEIYEEAVQIKEKGKNVPNHLLTKALKEEIIKERIKKIKEDTTLSLEVSKKLIEDLVKKEFTYEWLDKHDPKNFTLGLYCDCCASIASTLYGKDIMVDSVIRDDVQNLEIKDSQGNIIGKATVYINKEERYMVFNTIQVNDYYNFDHSESRHNIYNAFKRAVMDFVKKYDELNPDKSIKQVNIGCGANSFSDIISTLCSPDGDCLEAPCEFLDANVEQYIVYKNTKK